MITIDGTSYNVGVKSLKRKAPFLYKYAERTENGGLNAELIGVYFNYEITFVTSNDMAAYSALYDKLTEAEESHSVTVPWTTGTYTYTAYFTEVDDELLQNQSGGPNVWGELTVQFIATSPARS